MSQYKDIPKDDLDALSQGILSFVSFLDESLGADEWTSTQVAVVSGSIFLLMFFTTHSYRGVEWYSLLHACLTGFGSVACVYLDMYASEKLTGVPEPLRSVSCAGGPLTSLHLIVPSLTLGYSIVDILNGFRLGGAFLAHGFATFSVMMIFIQQGLPQFVNSMLVMELSTIWLTVLKAEFFNETIQVLSQAAFFLSFFVSRIVMAPYIWFVIINSMYKAVFVDKTNTCYPTFMFFMTFSFGMFFHCLNTYWFIKIIKKIQRKLEGSEAISNVAKED